MLKRMLDLFAAAPAEEPRPEQHRAARAACAVLLEAAWADDEFTQVERDSILAVLRTRFGFSQEEAEALFQDAEKNWRESTDLWRFTRGVNETFDVPGKIQILEEVWRLFYSDGTLTSHEDYLAHKLRDLLNLNQRQLIDAKMKVLKEIRGQ